MLDGFVCCRALRCRDGSVVSLGCHRWRWSRETYQEPCGYKQGRGRAGFDHHMESPHCPPPMAKRDPAACPQRGEKWESSGNTRQKQGKARCAKGLLPRISRGADFLGWMRGRSIDVMSLPSG